MKVGNGGKYNTVQYKQTYYMLYAFSFVIVLYAECTVHTKLCYSVYTTEIYVGM